MKKQTTAIILLTLLMLFGTALIAYPFVGGWFNSKEQAEAVTGYVAASKNVDSAALLKRAHRYNEELPVMPIGDYYTEIAQYPPEYVEYLSLPQTDVMARLSIPAIHVDLPVYHGTSDEVLSRGVGHIYGTSLPVGGMGTHAALSAHSGMVSKRMFDRLPELKVGDYFFITVLDEELAYQVISTEAYTPDEGVAKIVRKDDQDLVTLITCTPYGINTHRLLVTGSRVEGPPKRLGYDIGPTGESETAWWLWPLVALVGVSVGSGILAARRLKKRSTQEGEDSTATPTVDTQLERR